MNPTAVIVDDSNTMRTRLKSELTRLGFEVVGEGASGDKILSLYELHRPTLMMLDIVLPEMDGVSAATEVLRRYSAALIAMCSSLTARDKILAARTAGVKHFILKPFTSERIAQLVKQVLSAESNVSTAMATATAMAS